MKILHLINTMSGGGAERQCIKLVRELAKAGHDVSVILLRGGVNYQELLETGVDVINFDTQAKYSLGLFLRLGREIQKRKPDVIQSWLPMMDMFTGLLRLGMRFSWVMTERNGPAKHPWQRTRRRLARRADALVANCPIARNSWQQAISSDRCHFIPNIIDTQTILSEHDVPASPIPGANQLVVYAGRLFDKQKNVVQLLKAFIRVAQARPDVGVVILGEGVDRDHLEGMVCEAGLSDRIVFLGFVDRPWRYLNLADVIVSVSHYEGQSNVLLEAMVLKKPLVLSDIPEHRETLSSTGHATWVDRASIESITRGIQQALGDDSPGKYDSNHDVVVTNNAPRSITERYLEIYRSIQPRC